MKTDKKILRILIFEINLLIRPYHKRKKHDAKRIVFFYVPILFTLMKKRRTPNP